MLYFIHCKKSCIPKISKTFQSQLRTPFWFSARVKLSEEHFKKINLRNVLVWLQNLKSRAVLSQSLEPFGVFSTENVLQTILRRLKPKKAFLPELGTVFLAFVIQYVFSALIKVSKQ